MSDHEVRMIVLSTDDLDESIRFYSETLGLPLKFRDGAHYAALDGGAITLALATAVDHPIPGQVVVGIKTADVDAAAKAVVAVAVHRQGPVRRRPRAPRRGVRQQRQRRGLLQAVGPLTHLWDVPNEFRGGAPRNRCRVRCCSVAEESVGVTPVRACWTIRSLWAQGRCL